jgi:hypothetical protein
MKTEATRREREREMRKFEAEQRAATLAEKLLRSNSDHDPLWNISPKAPLVQRIGALIIGVFFLFFGVCLFSIGLQRHSWEALAVSLLFAGASAPTLWNAFRRRKIDTRE